MLAVRVEGKNGKTTLALVLMPENVERIKAGDPVSLNLAEYGGPDFAIIIGSTEDGFSGDAPSLLQHICRAWEHRKDDGYAPISITNGVKN